jgi:hypothetical protein
MRSKLDSGFGGGSPSGLDLVHFLVERFSTAIVRREA